nr:MAG TPA: hypothetical protein [Caudoviricetes sp.]
MINISIKLLIICLRIKRVNSFSNLYLESNRD